MHTKQVLILSLLSLSLLSCGGSDDSTEKNNTGTGTGSGATVGDGNTKNTTDNRPSGTYLLNASEAEGSIGCSESFIAFILSHLSAQGNGGPSSTTYEFELKPSGNQSIELVWPAFHISSMILGPSSQENTWVGNVSITELIDGCRITDNIALEMHLNDQETLEITLLNTFNNVKLTNACPFYSDSCSNAIVGTAQKL